MPLCWLIPAGRIAEAGITTGKQGNIIFITEIPRTKKTIPAKIIIIIRIIKRITSIRFTPRQTKIMLLQIMILTQTKRIMS